MVFKAKMYLYFVYLQYIFFSFINIFYSKIVPEKQDNTYPQCRRRVLVLVKEKRAAFLYSETFQLSEVKLYAPLTET